MEIVNLRTYQTSDELNEIQLKQLEEIKKTAFIEEPFEFFEVWDMNVNGKTEFEVICTDPDSATVFKAGTIEYFAKFLQSTIYFFTEDENIKELIKNIYINSKDNLPEDCILKYFRLK